MNLQCFERWLASVGWRLFDVKGTHRHYRNTHGRLVVVVVHGGHVRPDVLRWAKHDICLAERGRYAG